MRILQTLSWGIKLRRQVIDVTVTGVFYITTEIDNLPA
jgi:hypothetical protein